MAAFNKSILTKRGNGILVEAMAGTQVEFTRLETGSGVYDGTENLLYMDRLKNGRQSFPFLRYEKVSEECVSLIALVSNESLSRGYRMTEIGVYGKLKGSDEEILCSITTAIDGEADFWPSYNGVLPTRMLLGYHITISPDAVPCIMVDDNMILGEIASEANRANMAELALSDRISDLERPEFEEAKNRDNIKSGEMANDLFGKIKRWFSDLKPVAFSGKYCDLSGVPSKLSDFDNDSDFACTSSPVFTGRPVAPTPEVSSDDTQIATTAFVKAIIAMLVNDAPETLDTIGEVAAALAENRTFIEALNAAIGNKVDKVAGKGLSTNDYSTSEKNKLKWIASGAEVNVQSDWSVTDSESDAFIKNKPDFSETAFDGNAEKWRTARKINGIMVDGSEDRANYGTCDTASATAGKTVDCKGFSLVTGAEIVVKFTVTNSAASPTLNVNGTGAKPIFYRGAAIIAGYLAADRTYGFRYNGAQYDLVGDIDTDVRYDNMSPATASAAGRAGLVPAPGAGKQNGFLRGDATWVVPTANLLATERGIPLDQTMGKELKDLHDANEEAISELTSKLIDIVIPENQSLGNVQINASSDAVFTFTVSQKSEYKFLTCLNVSTTSGVVIMRGWSYNASTNIATVYLNNRHNADVTVGVSVNYLMIKE